MTMTTNDEIEGGGDDRRYDVMFMLHFMADETMALGYAMMLLLLLLLLHTSSQARRVCFY